jgi:glycosyltransferase involved in cell wall biosynthesis
MQLGVQPRDLVILQASRLDPWKGHRNLLKALHSLRAVPDWVCWIAGAPQRPPEEDYRSELIASAQQLGIADRVKFIGHRDDVETVLAACDVYCQANETPEPFGMVFIEALFAGKPVVGSASGGTLDIVTPECGILCDPSRGTLAAALDRLIRNPTLRREMAARGPARADTLCGSLRFSARLGEVLAQARSLEAEAG